METSDYYELLCRRLSTAIRAGPPSDTPMDTCSAYVPRRFCTGCCKEWGDIDVLLDLTVRECGRDRCLVYRELLPILGRGACCTRALFPCQRNISDHVHHAVSAISCKFTVPSVLALRQSRPRPLVSNEVRTVEDSTIPIMGAPALDLIEQMLI